MPAATELSDRQIAALGAVKDHQPCTAKQVADAIAAIDGSEPTDSRGWAQTIRRMPTLIVRDVTDGQYRLTNAGKAKIRRIRLAASDSE